MSHLRVGRLAQSREREPRRGNLGFVDEEIRRAIAERRLVGFSYDACERIAEPHDYGVIDGETRLFFFQVGGASRSGRPLGWRWAVVARISGLRLLDERFTGPRPAPSGRHQRWDKLFASVSRSVTKS